MDTTQQTRDQRPEMITRETFPCHKHDITSRWCYYFLIVDGTHLGTVRGTVAYGRDGLAGRKQQRWACFEAGGQTHETREAAERFLVSRELTVINPTLDADTARAALKEV